MSGLKEQRDVWRKRFEEGSDYPVLLETYKANRDKETWRSVIMVESLCEYATLLEEKVDKMYNRDTTECDILDEFGRVDTELAQLDSQIEFLEEERGRLCEYATLLEEKVDKMYNRDTTECDILDEFGRVDTELAQLDSQIEFLEEERGRLLMHHDRLSSLIDDINYFKGLNRV